MTSCRLVLCTEVHIGHPGPPAGQEAEAVEREGEQLHGDGDRGHEDRELVVIIHQARTITGVN